MGKTEILAFIVLITVTLVVFFFGNCEPDFSVSQKKDQLRKRKERNTGTA